MDVSLYDFQAASVEALRSNFREGIVNQVLSAPTGSGKTIVATYLLKACFEKGSRAVFVADRLALIDQTSAVLDRYDIPHGIIQAQNERAQSYAKIQVATIQTLDRRGWPEADLIIVDECFPAGTMVHTPQGPRDISLVRVGDDVYNAHGVGIVCAVAEKRARHLVTVSLSDGTAISCTPDHPFFTGEGWKCASALAVGEILFSREEVRELWRTDSTEEEQSGLRGARAGFWGEAVLRKILLEEVEEPHAECGFAGEDADDAEADSAHAHPARREWEAAAAASVSAPSRSRGRMGGGARSPDSKEHYAGVSASLQGGHRQPLAHGGGGDRRRESHQQGQAAAGPQERRPTPLVRVESVARIERESAVPVFNLRVSGHPSYFAGGVLVHNCHALHRATSRRILPRETKTIGLTATPFAKGMGLLYDAVVSVTTTNALIESGTLSRYRIFAASQPDMTGAKIRAGEWTEDEAATRSMPIIGDCVAEYLKHGRGKKFIAFGVNVAHCEEMQRQFHAAGVPCALYTYHEGDEERRRMVEEFRKPDSHIRGLLSVSAIAKGFDVSDVGVVILARPLRSSLAEHIQMFGRGLRSHPGKEECIYLDHSGNTVRFWSEMQEFFENGALELDDGKRKEAKKQEPKEKKPAKCPACHCVHKPAPTCPACGHQYERRSTVIHEAGELSEVGGRASTKAEKQAIYSQLLAIARERNHPPGWVAHRYKDRTGVWPRGLDERPIPPTPEMRAWVLSRVIAFAKGQKRGVER